MPRKSRRNPTGLGWAARVSGKKIEPIAYDKELLQIAGNLAASIQNACWLTYDKQANLHCPTLAMQDAVAAYLEWKNNAKIA